MCVLNLLFRIFGQTVEFSVDLKISSFERQQVESLLEPLGLRAVLTNDYWSYDQEAFVNCTKGAEIFNAVSLMMNTGSLTTTTRQGKGLRYYPRQRTLFSGTEARLLSTPSLDIT